MADQRGTFDVIATTVAGLLDPLEDRLSAGGILLLLEELGLKFPPAAGANASLTTAISTVVQKVHELPDLVTALTSAIKAENIPQILSKALELANNAKVIIEQSENIGNAIKSLGTIPPAELNQFASQFPGRLLDYLVIRNLEGIPGAAESLEFIGAVERTDVPATDANHPAFTVRKLHLDKLTGFISNPATQLGALYDWGKPGFTGLKLLQTLQRLMTRAGISAVLDTTGPAPVLDALFLEIRPRTDLNPSGITAKLFNSPKIDASKTFQQNDWSIKLVLDAQLAVGVEMTLQSNEKVSFKPPAATQLQGDALVEWTGGKPGGTPYLILGEPGGSRLEAGQLVARAGVGFAWNAATNTAEGDFSISGEVKQGKVVISMAEADGFLGKILGGFGIESNFDVGIGFSTKGGIFFQGSATLDIQIPMHVSIGGVVEFTALTLSFGIQNNTFPIGIAADIKANLGPLQAVVQEVGVSANLSVPDNHKGNAGPLDFSLGFKPPKGVGLSVDTGIIKGGGFLFIDPDRGEYAGALELTLSGFIALKAIGLITTKMPDGSKGFSLLIIITAEFGTGIQLGFGFVLLGVGGLLGLNRSMKLQPLAEGVRTGAVDGIMFPKDVVANAPKIISDLRTFFPPQEGVFLIGPMAKLGWGTPALVTVSLGIIIEIPPGDIAILGVIRVALPTDDAAILVLQVNFIGALEFDKKRLWFFASLFDSRVVFITIEGEMGLLVAFGDDANFVVSVGGFHPRYSPPPLPFPSPKRVAVNLINTDVARVRIEGYFAVTSNTVQFGAAVDVFFGLDEVNVQGHLSFDALFQFSPFYFIIQISASFSVNVFGIGLFSVSFSGSLEGPTPWRVKGSGEISILFFSISVDFDVTWGESQDTSLPPIAILPLFKAELQKPDTWRALPPATNALNVSLRKLPDDDPTLVLHPVGILRISQRYAPLDLTLDKVGSQKPSDVNLLHLDVAAGGLSKKADTQELFAPAQYQNMSDSDKLSRPAFSEENAGLDLAPTASLATGRMDKRIVRYEEIIIDTNYRRFQRRFRPFNAALFHFFLNGSAVTKSPLSQAYKSKFQPFADKIDTGQDTFTVAFQSNNKAFAADSVSFASEASAREYLQRKGAADPNLHESLHVIPSTERAA